MIPVVVVGGYLGAGKTTLVNHLLRHAGGRRLAVMVNDFGALSIDAQLIEGASGDVVELAGGCVCCSFGADLLGSLSRVLQRDPAPDSVLIECSGVGLPAAVARTAGLAPGGAVEGVAVVVDAAEIRRLAGDTYVGDTVRAQLREADLLIVNQTDRVHATQVRELARWLDAQSDATPQVPATHGVVPPEVVLGLRAAAGEGKATGPLAPQPSPRPYQRAQFESATRRFSFSTRRIDHAVDPQMLAAELAAARSGLLRAKGIVRGLDGRDWLVQVMGRRYSVEPAPGDRVLQRGLISCIALAEDPAVDGHGPPAA